MKKLIRLLPAVALAALQPACAPVFSDLQSARLLEPGKYEVTPSASVVTYSDEDESSEHVQDHFGVQLARGVTDRLELRTRFEHVSPASGDGAGVEVIGAGPKIAIVPDKVALYVPIGCAFGGDYDCNDSSEVQPTVLLTAPLGSALDLTGAVKLIHPLSGDGDDLLAFNLGAGIGPESRRWTVRPEVGILKNPGEDGTFTHFSLGVSIRP